MSYKHPENWLVWFFIIFIITTGFATDREPNPNERIKASITFWVKSSSDIIIPQVMLRIAELESNFKPTAKSPTGAKGLFQFTTRTWNRVVELYGKSDNVSKKQVWDIRANTVMAVRLAELNAFAFEELLGRFPQAHEIYMMHNIGVKGTMTLIKGSNFPVTKELIGSNPKHNPKYLTRHGAVITAAEAIRNYKNDFKDL